MTKGYKVLITVLAILFSSLAMMFGYGIVGGMDISFGEKYGLNFIFLMQFLSTVWCATGLWRKMKE